MAKNRDILGEGLRNLYPTPEAKAEGEVEKVEETTQTEAPVAQPVEAKQEEVPVTEETPETKVSEAQAPVEEDKPEPKKEEGKSFKWDYEPSSLKEDKGTAEASTEPKSAELTDDLVLSKLSEMLGQEFKSTDELRSVINKEPKQEFANEDIAKLNKFIKETGRGINDFIATQSVDYKEMTDQDVVMDYLRKANPSLTQKEVEIYFKNTYKTDQDKFDEDDVTMGKITLKKDATQARAELQALKDKYTQPIEGFQTKEELQAKSAENRQATIDHISSTIDELEGISFAVNDKGDEFSYRLSDADRAKMKDMGKNYETLLSDRYRGEDGKLNAERMAMELYVLDNMDNIVKAIANQYRSTGTENVIKDIKNPSYSTQQVERQPETKTVASQIIDQMFGK